MGTPVSRPNFRRLSGQETRQVSMFESSIVAQYEGWCEACSDVIEAGFDTITLDEPGNTWIHVDCADHRSEES